MGAVALLISLFRKHSKFSREGNQVSNISDAEIEAAKKKWANLVLSNDE
jgi:hypothetical protein